MIIHTQSFRYLWEVMENQEYQFLFNLGTVMDLGCETGSFTLWIQKQAQMIHAVDMDESLVNMLNQSVKDNGFTNVKTYVDRVKNLGEFMSGHAIPLVDLLKIDIEGDEIEVFQNQFPKERVRMIVGEYHTQPVEQILTDMGYRYTEYPNRHFMARI